MNYEILIDGAEFWQRLRTDVEAAAGEIYVQTLSLEGDRVGTALRDLLCSSSAADRRVLADDYSRFMLSDRFLYLPRNLLDAELRREVRETRLLARDLRAAGVGLRVTNPAGLFLQRIAARNHKKLVLVGPSVVYLGGINFSEHNFAWHDMMIRCEDPALFRFLRDDFLATWEGRDQSRSARFGDVEIHLLNGRRSASGFAAIFALLDAAECEIFVESPYLSFPFVERLAAAVRRGVRVRAVTPERNNYPVSKEALLWNAARGGLEVWLYPERMTHLKAMSIDDRALIFGSANFDWLGYGFCQEVVAVIHDAAVVAEFRRRVVEPDLRVSRRFEGPLRPISGRLADLRLRASAVLCAVAAR